MSKIILNPGRPDQRVFELPSGSHTIGRDERADVRCPDPSVSPEHARIDINAEGAVLQSLVGDSGILCEGEKTDFRVLLGGEIFKCGEVTFAFVHEAPSAESFASVDVAGALADQSRERLQILLKVSQLLSSPGSIDTVLEKILELVFEILDVDRATVLMANEETGNFEPRVAKTRPGLSKRQHFYSQKIVSYVQSERRAALIADAASDARIDPSESIVQQSIRSSMCAPLLSRDEADKKVIGVLYVDNVATPNRFGHDDLEFLSSFANQAAIAIENSRLYQKLERETISRTHLLRFFPPAMTKVLSQANLETIDTEITALFSDISGFTAMSSRMAPREVVELLNEYFPTMIDIVFKHEGTLEKYIGDALMAVWGAPYRHPLDADRAVQAAVDMQRAMRALNSMKGALHRFEIHIGLNSGPVAAGNIGSDRLFQYATIGDATNVAARVCSVSQAGQILVSQATLERLRPGRWPVEELGPVQVKGKDEPVRLYRLRWEEAPRSLDGPA